MMTQETRPARSRFWTDDRDLSIFLAMLVTMILVPTLLPVGLLGRLIGDALISVMLISGAAAVADRPRTVLFVSVSTGATLLVRWASWLFATPNLAVWREISTLATLGILCYVVLRLVLRRGPITTNRIEGAIAVYLLLGLTWAHAYGLVALWHPGAFTGAVDGRGPLLWTYYYSFVTLTTMGYGDIMPVHPLARALAVLEALTGQLYLAIMLARLVSLELQSRRDG
jgi:Ion channel